MIETLIRTHLQGFTAGRILDVGPGFSSFSRAAAEVTGAKEITYLDFDTKVLDWQMAEAQRAGISATGITLRLDATDLGTLQGPIDIIHCQEVLEHLPNAEQVLAALAAKLAPGGRMVITVPSRVSERWIKAINPAYMRNEPFGHVNEYDRSGLEELLGRAGLQPLVFVPTQPHYFVGHTWFYGSRMRSEPSSGRILTGGLRGAVYSRVFRLSRWFFNHTGPRFWGRIMPRNYFVLAAHR
ncbi:MAG: methyltransferase domain-containing protein [Ignavibacteriae bacterium]|nr:methyltransferase domain-containing protein [Ignavibacteriota bacterium]